MSELSRETIIVTIVASENRRQRRHWQQTLKRRGWTANYSVADCWAKCLERLGLQAAQCDECGMTVSFIVNGPRAALKELISGEFPIARVELREARAANCVGQGQTRKHGAHSEGRHK